MKSFDKQPPLKAPFICQYLYTITGVIFLGLILILLGFSDWTNVSLNFLLSFLFLAIPLPLFLKASNPGLNFEEYLKILVERSKSTDKTIVCYLLEYLGVISSISFTYTVLGYARFDLEFIKYECWAFILPFPILLLLLMSALSLVRVLYQLGLINLIKDESTSKLKEVFKIFLVGVPLLFTQIYFLQVGVKAIDSFNSDVEIKRIDQRIKYYHDNGNK